MVRSKRVLSLELRGDLSRKEMRRKVIEAFLDEEAGTEYEYWYHVETLSDNRRMFLRRPTRRFNFDFKIEVERWKGKGTHKEVTDDLLKKGRENPGNFRLLIKAVRQAHAGKDVDKILSAFKLKFKSGWDVEFLLKLLKWLFILEDIYYWNYKGRDKLMEFLEETLSQRELI